MPFNSTKTQHERDNWYWIQTIIEITKRNQQNSTIVSRKEKRKNRKWICIIVEIPNATLLQMWSINVCCVRNAFPNSIRRTSTFQTNNNNSKKCASMEQVCYLLTKLYTQILCLSFFRFRSMLLSIPAKKEARGERRSKYEKNLISS